MLRSCALYRYTNLAATIHLLRTKKITFLDPATSDDRNDAFYLEQYKAHKRAKAVLALCFSQAEQRYHHWRIFSNGADGVCVEFDKTKLLLSFEGNTGIVHRSVEYRLVGQVKRAPPVDMLPFLKRKPYEDEREYRLIYLDREKAVESREYGIELACIKQITLSPWMPRALSTPVKETLKSIRGCSRLAIVRSTLIENERWKAGALRE